MKRNPFPRTRALILAAGLALLVGCFSATTHVRGCEPGDGLTPICGFSNPEDLAVAPGGDWLLVSQFPRSVADERGQGSLLAFRPSDGERRMLYPPVDESPALPTGGAGRGDPACTEPPELSTFAPHGIDLRESTLFVVNHGGREAIEIFEVDSGEQVPSLRWTGCVELPDADMANDVVGLADGRIVTTRMMPRESGPMTMLRIAMGWSTGWVSIWTPGEGWKPWANSEDSGPNGLAVSADGETLYYAAWGRNALVRVSGDGSSRDEAPLGFHVDNLTWSGDGSLLAAGQGGPITGITQCGSEEGGTCAMPIGVARVDPRTLEVTTLIEHDPAVVGGAVSVALEHDGKLWLGTFSGDRLLTWDLP